MPPAHRSRLIVSTVGLFLAACLTSAWAHDLAGHLDESKIAARTAERFSGVIEALVVNDRVAGREFRFPQLRMSDGHAISLIGAPVDALRAGDGVTLRGVRNGKAFEVTGVDRHDVAVRPAVKSSASVEGRFALFHSDDLEQGASQFHYEVHADDGSVTALELPALPPVLQGGMRVQVLGHPGTASALVPDEILILAPPPEEAPAGKLAGKAVTVHSMLVIMANFSNTVAPSFTQAEAQAVMTSNANSVAKLYNEASYGQHQLNVTVTPTWVNMAFAKPAGCIDTVLASFSSAANTAAAALGPTYNPANYEYVVYVFPGGGCGWSGLAYIGYPRRAYINGPNSFNTLVVSHEVGHNFGLLHAASIKCTGVVIGGSCTVAEYGDPFSSMGNQHAGHFNVVQKQTLGWVSAPTIKTHAAGSATYTINPLETGGGATYGVKIPTPNGNRTYWLEYRQPVGFDGMWSGWVSNGAQVRLGDPFEVLCGGCDAYSDDTELLDMTPATSTFSDAALTVGSTFNDPNYPVTISVLSATPSALTVQVTTPGSIGATTTTLASSANPSPTGAPVTFTATVSGTAPTGSVAFKDAGAGISGCSAVALTGSGNSRSAACTTSALASGTHTITATYAGDSANASSSSPTVTQTISSTGWLGYLQGGNLASGSNSAVAAGSGNNAGGQGSFVGAGTSNMAAGVSSLVIGGFDNHAAAIDSLIGAGAGNRATGARSVIIGGGYNLASGPWSFVGGGGRETGSGTAGSAIQDHIAAGKWSAIIGGKGNRAGTSGTHTGPTVVGGEQNQATNTDATVVGGTLNVASGLYAAIAGGQGNAAGNTGTTVGGGGSNTASGAWATVLGGNVSTASGSYSLAGGRRAKATLAGSLVLADSSAFDFTSALADELSVRAAGGARVVTAIGGGGSPTAGVTVAAGSGTWTSLSDRAAKRDLAAVDADAVLAKLAGMPIYTWRYRTETSGALHMGPTAQDFQAAFGLGDTNRRITTVDADGVALAALHALQRRVAQKEAAVTERAARLAALRARLAQFEAGAADLTLLKASLAALLREARDPYPTVHAIYPAP